MASGVAINEEVDKYFKEVRVRTHGSCEDDRLKLVVFCVNGTMTEIVVDKERTKLVKDFHGEDDVFKKVVSMLPPDDCRYALYDCTYETKETHKEDLIFIMWAPDTASLKSRMVYAASKAALKAKFPGLKHELQVNDPSDCDPSCLVDKLGGRGVVTKLEKKTV
ncbi:hypothetical protein AGOR_G00213300 [Albula goreensis]|uniref:ADF-H domain-containing protein n=1 Tax=Albula goreensis TaxID=1534307 RepID=A0A8T3CV62_9TELE|nr:hypothetical protein AGOR_G00213300 [Albula goreensis]